MGKKKKKYRAGGFVAADPPAGDSQKPWKALWPLLAAAFAVRVAAAYFSDYTLHPDEIMQYMEPAHRLVFGNGVVHWEYLYGARSWLVPGLVAGVLQLCKFVGWGEPAYYVGAVKFFFCAVATAIPWGMYVAGRGWFGEAAARIALVCGVFWYELIAFAHKPMTEFIATALLFLLLGHTFQKRKISPARAAAVAALCVLTVAVRFQYAPAVLIAGLVAFVRSDSKAAAIAGGAAMLLAIGMLDYVTWGGFFHSYVTNARVNFYLSGVRGGESSPLIFLHWLLIGSGAMFFAAVGGSLMRPKKHWLPLALVAAVLLPHIFSGHREYRFIFAVIPLWIILFSALAAAGQKTKPGAFAAALGFFFSASVLGMGHWLPAQSFVYRGFSAEKEVVGFFADPRRTFALYQKLAADESLAGLWDNTEFFANTGGYYYLHRAVPFYDRYSWRGMFSPPQEGADYVSHIISPPPAIVRGIQKTEQGIVLQTENGGLFLTPTLMHDRESDLLVFWDDRGGASAMEGFVKIEDGAAWTLWKSDQPRAVKEWRHYRPNPDGEAMYGVLRRALGADVARPAGNFGIVYK